MKSSDRSFVVECLGPTRNDVRMYVLCEGSIRENQSPLSSFDALNHANPRHGRCDLCASSLLDHFIASLNIPHSSCSRRPLQQHAPPPHPPTHFITAFFPAPNTCLTIDRLSHRPSIYPSAPACCFFHERCGDDTKARSPPATAPAFHAQACLRTWKVVCSCIARLGKMLLYGLQGQQLGEHGEVLYDREGALFDTLWELLLRFLVPYASEAAR